MGYDREQLKWRLYDKGSIFISAVFVRQYALLSINYHSVLVNRSCAWSMIVGMNQSYQRSCPLWNNELFRQVQDLKWI